MTKRGKIKVYNQFNKNSLTYKLQELASERKKLMGNLIRLCSQPFITYLYITLFEQEIIVLPTIFFLLQMIVIIFDTPSCLRRILRLDILKEEVVKSLYKYESQEIGENSKALVKKI